MHSIDSNLLANWLFVSVLVVGAGGAALAYFFNRETDIKRQM